MTGRQIALSNLSLLPGSLFRGPEETWKIAREAGFDGMKINPLRGWDVTEIRALDIPLLAFEGPWRNPYSFQRSFQVLLKGGLREFVIDTVLFGKGADTRARLCGHAFPEAIGVDCPSYYGQNPNFVRETNFERWPDILDTDTPVCLDTWHIRDYPESENIFEKILISGRVRTIDVQTRNYDDMRQFFLGRETALLYQLYQLAALPQLVSASVELLPQHLWKLQMEFSLSRTTVLRHLQEQVRKYLK